MKKVLLTLLGIIVVVGLLGGAGFIGYRMGLNQGARVASNRTAQLPPQNKGFDPCNMPNFDRNFGLQGMPGRNFGNGMNRGFDRGFGMMGRGRGFGFFGPFQFLFRLAVLALIIWVIYMLFKGSGWKLTRQQPAQVAKVEPQETEPKTE